MEEPMTSTIRITIGALIFSVSVSSFSQEESIRMFGNLSCSEWNKGVGSVEKAWLMGFVSGVNLGRSTPRPPENGMHRYNALKHLPSAEYAVDYVSDWCKKNSVFRVSEAVLSLQAEMQDKQRK
jgi:hypothetical protein